MGNIDENSLTVALGTVEAVQATIRRADAKAAILAGGQISVVTIALGATAPADPSGWALALGILFLAGLVVSAALLGAALWPRLDTEESRFAFPSLARLTEPPPAPGDDLADEAWRLAIRLSCTARRKYQLIRLALMTLAGSFLGIVGWLALSSTPGLG